MKTLHALALTAAASTFTFIVAVGLGTYISRNAESIMMSRVEKSVLRLDGDRSWGSGFIVTSRNKKQVIVTNAHVCDQPTNKMVGIAYDGKRYDLTIVVDYDWHDLCLLVADKPLPLPSLKLAKKPVFGETLYLVGYPLIPYMTSTSGKLKGNGDVAINLDTPIKDCNKPKYKIFELGSGKSKKDVCWLYVPVYKTTIMTDHGSSGSPVVNSDAEVVGVSMAVDGGVSWASIVPLPYVKNLLNNY